MTNKINADNALKQYNKLDKNAQCLAEAMLRLMSATFLCIYQTQTPTLKSDDVNSPAPENTKEQTA